MLEHLQDGGEQVLDLEKLACHKGSSFGSLGEKAQPTQEQFENEVIYRWKTLNPQKPVWLEDESRMIGNKVIPEGLWNLMRNAQVINIELPLQQRIDYLTKEYGAFETVALQQAIERIGKRLGPQHMKEALQSLQAGDLKRVCEICLVYYDKSYGHGLTQREPGSICTVTFDAIDPKSMAKTLTQSYYNALSHGRH